MVKVLLDTSVLIEFSRIGEGVFEELMLKADAGEVELLVSSIVIYEYWGGKSMDKREVREVAEEMFDGLRVVVVSEKIAKRAGRLRREDLGEGMDLMIAATALEERAQVATLNKKHFKKIKGLQVWGE